MSREPGATSERAERTVRPACRHPERRLEQQEAPHAFPRWSLVVLVEAAVLVAFVVLLAHKVWKAGLESSVWQDEMFSLQVVQRSPAGVVEAMREDFHPPLYPLVLKAWLAGLEAIGVARALPAARLLNVVVWVLFALVLAVAARRYLGRTIEAALLPLLVAGSPHLIQFTSDARSYGLAAVAVTLIGLLLAGDLAQAGEEDPGSGRRWRRWLTISALATIAAWSHLLTLPLLLGLAFMWVAGAWWIAGAAAVRMRLGPPAFAALGFLIAVLPWLVPALRQVGAYRVAAPAWMTAATWPQLARVLYEWIPFGRHGTGEGPLAGLFKGAGLVLLGFLMLLAVAAVGRRKRGECELQRTIAMCSGVGLLVVAWGFVVFLWALQRADLVRMFYAPRYPCLGAGLVGLAIGLWLWAYRRGWRRAAAWATAALWLSISAVGHATAASADRAGGVVPFVDLALAEGGIAGGAVVAAYPGSVGEALPESRAARHLVPLETALCELSEKRPVVAVRLSPWRQLFSPRDLLLDETLRRGLLARDQKPLAAGRSLDYEAHLLSGATDLSAQWCREGAVASDWVDSTVGEWSNAAELRPEDGWSFLDFDERLRPSRWSKSTAARVEIPRSRPGSEADTLVLVGFAAGLGARAVVEVGGRELASLDREGPFALCLRLPRELASSTHVVFRSPLWRPDDLYRNGDRRWLGVQLRAVGRVEDEKTCLEVAGAGPLG